VRLPRSLPTLPTTQSMASRLTGRLSSSCTVIGTGSRPSGRTAGWDRSGRPWSALYPAIRATNADPVNARWLVKTVAGVQRRQRFEGSSESTLGPAG